MTLHGDKVYLVAFARFSSDVLLTSIPLYTPFKTPSVVGLAPLLLRRRVSACSCSWEGEGAEAETGNSFGVLEYKTRVTVGRSTIVTQGVWPKQHSQNCMSQTGVLLQSCAPAVHTYVHTQTRAPFLLNCSPIRAKDLRSLFYPAPGTNLHSWKAGIGLLASAKCCQSLMMLRCSLAG